EVKVEIKLEVQDEVDNIETKCLVFTSVDSLAVEDTKQEGTSYPIKIEDEIIDVKCESPTTEIVHFMTDIPEVVQNEKNTEKLLQKPQLNVKRYVPYIAHVEESTYSRNINKRDEIFSPSESSETTQTDSTCNVSHDRSGLNSSLSKSFKLSVCKNSVAKTTNLHKDSGMHNNEKAFRCLICNKSFALKGLLIRHSFIHSNDQHFKCLHCNRSFARKDSLCRHLRLHNNERPFKCTVCNKSFSNTL
ncbi:hypothetical protein L9F63_025416, partial [Diploptera punctata]